MAKGKKSSGKHYTSKGERSNVKRSVVKAMRRDYIENRGVERIINQQDAWMKNKNVMLTIQNPNKNHLHHLVKNPNLPPTPITYLTHLLNKLPRKCNQNKTFGTIKET